MAFEMALLLPMAFLVGTIAAMIGVGGGMHACNYLGIGCKQCAKCGVITK